MLIRNLNVLWLGNLSTRSCPWWCQGPAQSWSWQSPAEGSDLQGPAEHFGCSNIFFPTLFHFVTSSFRTSSLKASLEGLALCSPPISPLSALLILTKAEPAMVMKGPGNSAISSSVMWCSCCCQGRSTPQDSPTKLFESPSQSLPGWQAFEWSPVLSSPLTRIFPVELLSEDSFYCYENG